MRPRISRKEAAYLVEVLNLQTETMKGKVRDLEELERDFKRIIFELKNPVQVLYSEKGFFVGHKILGNEETLALVRLARELKEEHPKIIVEKFRYYDCLQTHMKLKEKYTAIANGMSHRGTYKHLNNHILYPEDGKLTEDLSTEG
jgi:hypothetical protein